MGVPRIKSARASSLWVNTPAYQDTVRLLLLSVLLRLYLPDGADFIRGYRRYRSRASQFFDDCVSGAVQPVKNEFQARLDALLPGQSSAHLYVDRVPGTKAVYFASLLRGKDGLWRLRHRKIRLAPETLARDGVFASWNNPAPHPDVVCAQTPLLDRVVTGGLSCEVFAEEVNSVFEVARQLTQVCAVCEMVGCLHRYEIITWHEPGRVVLRADMTGNPWTRPYGFTGVTVRPYARPGSVKARVTVWACASDAGLYTVQSPRSIQPTIKGVTEYGGSPYGPAEKLLLSELLLSRLIPVAGAVDPEGRVNLFGLHYDIDQQRGVVGQIAAGRSLRASAGLPLIRPAHQAKRQLVWVPNSALLSILRELVYDPSPDEDSRLDRWYALMRAFRSFGVRDMADLPDYFALRGLPLPNGASEHVAALTAAVNAFR